MIPRYHMTAKALHAEKRNRARVVVWNDSSTLQLMMTPSELRKMERCFGLNIEEVISDSLMRKLLKYYYELGLLIDSEDLQRV